MAKENRTKFVSVRLTPEEREILEKRSRQENKSPSNYFRSLLHEGITTNITKELEMKPFYKSRKFLIAGVDAIAGLIALYVSQFLPEQKDLILQTWAYLQPVVVIWIGAIAYEDGQAMRAGLKG